MLRGGCSCCSPSETGAFVTTTETFNDSCQARERRSAPILVQESSQSVSQSVSQRINAARAWPPVPHCCQTRFFLTTHFVVNWLSERASGGCLSVPWLTRRAALTLLGTAFNARQITRERLPDIKLGCHTTVPPATVRWCLNQPRISWVDWAEYGGKMSNKKFRGRCNKKRWQNEHPSSTYR